MTESMKSVLVGAISLALYAWPGLVRGQTASTAPSPGAGAVQVVRYENEHSQARVEPVRMNGRPGLAIHFEGTKDLHYYARSQTAPSPDLHLQVEATAQGVSFDKAVFPAWRSFTDSTGKAVEVYVGDFRVFVPIRGPATPQAKADITVRIKGIACTSQLCLPPFDKTLTTTLDLHVTHYFRSFVFSSVPFSREKHRAVYSLIFLGP